MIKFFSRIKKIEHVRRVKSAWRDGDEIRTEYEDRGWYMLLDGSWESLYVGGEKPDGFNVGDEIEVVIKHKKITS
jgi:hypothetical protein